MEYPEWLKRAEDKLRDGGDESESIEDAADRWRRLGALMTGVNTAKALSADEKVVALDGSNPWDSIYLARLYARRPAVSDPSHAVWQCDLSVSYDTARPGRKARQVQERCRDPVAWGAYGACGSCAQGGGAF